MWVIESLAVLAVVALLAGFGVLLPLVPAALVVQAGGALIALGAIFGLPTGFWYHVKLRSVLRATGSLPAHWWIRPVALHDEIPAAQRTQVLRWFYAGGAGFLAILLGSALLAGGVLLEAHRGGSF